MKRILTIAGSDSGGGAGIQADLKTITVLGGFGLSAITALTAQNTMGVQDSYPIPVAFIEKQIDSVMTDIGVDATKTGMLVNSEIITAVSRKIREYQLEKVVVDPVMSAQSGDELLDKGSLKTLVSELIPLAFLITPNLSEASILAGMETDISNTGGMKHAAQRIHDLGAKNVLIKGGHLSGEAIDLLYYEGRFIEYSAPRVNTGNTHGTGCTYSAAITTEIAKGKSLPEAVGLAKEFVTTAIKFSLDLGGGCGPTNHYAPIKKEVDRYRIIQDLKKAIQRITKERIGYIIPEVQSNLGFALPYADSVKDVAAVPGRIFRVKDSIYTHFEPEFGASQHIAKIILTILKYDSRYRSAMNIKYSPDTVDNFQKSGFIVKSFDRNREPKEVKEKEGSTLAWGVLAVLNSEKAVPDIIYDQGEPGKEPMIRVIGMNPDDVLSKIIKVNKLKDR